MTGTPAVDTSRGQGPGTTGGGQHPGRRLLRYGLFAVSAVVVLCAALLVPMPLVESTPGGATPVAPLVEVDAQTTAVSGELSLLTVRIDQPSLVETVRALLDDRRDLAGRETVIPPTVDHRTYVELQQQEFRRSFRVAAAVGLRAAGYEVGLRTAPQVVAVMPNGPADGHLQAGDVVRRFEGTAVSSLDDLLAEADGTRLGEELTLRVERDGQPMEVTVTAGEVPGLDHPGMGITLQTLEQDIQLPVDVGLADQRGIGGPSAGMMVAVTVYDLVSEEDLAAGRRIVGTGTVDGDGSVGPIGSLREKALTAVEQDADLMLVPAAQEDAARRAADGRIEVVGVATVEEALTALRP